MTTDPTPLQERIARRFYEASGLARPWEKASGPAHDRYMARARMVLPIIAAEVRTFRTQDLGLLVDSRELEAFLQTRAA